MKNDRYYYSCRIGGKRSYGIYKCQSSARTNRERERYYMYICIYILWCVLECWKWIISYKRALLARPSSAECLANSTMPSFSNCLAFLFAFIIYFAISIAFSCAPLFLFHLLLGYFYWYLFFFGYICNLANGISCCWDCCCELPLPAVVVVGIVQFTCQLSNRVASSLCSCTKQTNNSCLCMTQCAKARDKTFRVRRTCLLSVLLPPPPLALLA